MVGAMKDISKTEVFLGFLKIGLLGFGGVGPWARHVIVEESKWLSDKEFAEVVGIGQVLPGPNTMNAAVLIGDWAQGMAGVLLGLVGQMAMPLVIVTSLALVYDRFAAIAEVRAGLAGAAAAAAGLVLGTALKILRNVKPSIGGYVIVGLGFAAIAVFRWPLVPVILGLAPLAIVTVLVEQRR
jgi:chromate transporter